jgi:hypothetical protein
VANNDHRVFIVLMPPLADRSRQPPPLLISDERKHGRFRRDSTQSWASPRWGSQRRRKTSGIADPAAAGHQKIANDPELERFTTRSLFGPLQRPGVLVRPVKDL